MSRGLRVSPTKNQPFTTVVFLHRYIAAIFLTRCHLVPITRKRSLFESGNMLLIREISSVSAEARLCLIFSSSAPLIAPPPLDESLVSRDQPIFPSPHALYFGIVDHISTPKSRRHYFNEKILRYSCPHLFNDRTQVLVNNENRFTCAAIRTLQSST